MKDRVSTIDLDDGIEITIRPRITFGKIAYLIALLLAYLGLPLWVASPFESTTIFQPLLLLIELIWVVVFLLFLYSLLWMFLGKERILVTEQILKQSKILFYWTRSKSYVLPTIWQMRADANNWPHISSWGISGGGVRFEYPSGKQLFGLSVTQLEAERIVSTIEQRFPSVTSRL